MKKGFKLAGTLIGAAVVAASVPFVIRKDSETGEKTFDALLWQLKTRPNQETGKRDIELNILPNRLRCKIYTEVPEEELVVDEDSQPECDIELTLDPKLDEEDPVPAASIDVEA